LAEDAVFGSGCFRVLEALILIFIFNLKGYMLAAKQV